ncbi:MAG: T9SS type A sorting domain-containing protein [Chitinophagaceae bacterium]|nr:T9SS type A sorting domain-containing protein [Chitinophagaceae bacterium]
MKKIISLMLLCIFGTGANQLLAQLQITSGAEIKLTTGALLTLKDINLVNDGAFDQTEGTVRITGNANTGISGSQPIRFKILEIDKAVGFKVLLQRTVHVDQQIGFVNGLLDLNGYNISLSPTALLLGEAENNRITGTNGGFVEITNTLNAPASANPGNLGAILTSATNLGSTIIRRGHQSQVNLSGQGSSVLRYYDIIPANNSALNATLRFLYFDAELNALPELILTQWKSNNNTSWTDQGFTSRDQVNNYVEKTGIMDFSRWTLSSPGNPLPVTGLELQGEWRNNTARLHWKTITETDNHHFIIQRYYQNGQQQFADIATKSTLHIGGNSSDITLYNHTDATAQATQGFIFYRIQQVDINNRFSYSNTIRLTPDGVVRFIDKVYPTIVQNNLYIQAGNAPIQNMTLTLHDMSGRLIMQKLLVYQSQQLELPVMVNGAYMLKVQSGEWEFTGRIIKK